MPSHLLTWITFAPSIGACMLFAAPRRATRALALVTTLVALGLSTWTCFGAFHVGSADFQGVERVAWLLAIHAEYHVGVDGLSLALVWLATLSFFAAAVASPRVAGKAWYALLLLLEVGVLGVLVSLDLFLFFAFWQATLVLIGCWLGGFGGAKRAGAATSFVLHASLGSALLLVALVALRLDAGTFSLPALSELARAGKLTGEHLRDGGALLGVPFRAWCSWFSFLGFALWIPLVPLHAWLADARAEAPPALALLQGGIAAALGAFGLLRVCFPLFTGEFREHAYALGVLGTATVVYGALVALRQRDFTRLAACQALSQMGFVLLGAAAMTERSFSGAAQQLFAAAAASAALLLAASFLRGRVWEELGGLRRATPRTFALTTLAVLAAIGMPGFASFTSQLTTARGVLDSSDARFRWLALAACAVAAVSAVNLLSKLRRVFFGAPNIPRGDFADASARETCAVVLLLAASLLCGVFPRLFAAPFQPSVAHWLELLWP